MVRYTTPEERSGWKGAGDPSLRKKGVLGTPLPPELDLEMHKAERERFTQVFSAVDRILNPGVNRVELVHLPEMDAPAWTSGDVIYLNTAVLPDLRDGTPSDLAMWLGMNSHELGHTLYSPRADSYLHRMVIRGRALYPKLAEVEMLVEDQRQERLLVAQFQPLSTYLTAAVMGMLAITSPQNLGQVWPFVAGRTWLPVELRAAIRRAYPGKHAKKIAKLIGQYQNLADPGEEDAEQAYKLLARIHELFIEDDYEMEKIPNGCGGQVATEGEATAAYTDDEDQESGGSEGDEAALDEADDEAEQAESEGKGKGKGGKGKSDKGKPDRNSIKPESGEGEGEAKEAGGEELGEGGGFDPDNTEPGEGDPNQGSGGRGAGSLFELDDLPRTTGALAEALKQVVENNLESDASVQDDIKAMSAALQVMPEGNIKLPRIQPNPQPATPELMSLAEQMSRHFRQFTDRALPYWDRRTETGRFNVGRYLNSDGYDYDTMFDRFEPGMQDDLSLDVTVLMDRSGSMQGQWNASSSPIQDAARAGWAIHKAVEDAGGNTTLIYYDDNSQVLVQPGEKATNMVPYVNAGGNTDPTSGLVAVYRRLIGVEAKHKLVIGVTDGGWSRGIEALREIGALPDTTTVTVLLVPQSNMSGYSRQMLEQHEAAGRRLGGHITKVLASPMGLTELVEEIVTHRMARVMDGYDGA